MSKPVTTLSQTCLLSTIRTIVLALTRLPECWRFTRDNTNKVQQVYTEGRWEMIPSMTP